MSKGSGVDSIWGGSGSGSGSGSSGSSIGGGGGGGTETTSIARPTDSPENGELIACNKGNSIKKNAVNPNARKYAKSVLNSLRIS